MISIYVIINNETDEVVYVGKTTKPIEERFEQHKKNKKSVDKYIYLQENDCRIESVNETDDVEKAKKSENRWIISKQTRINGLNKKYESKDVKQNDFARLEDAEEIIKKLMKK